MHFDFEGRSFETPTVESAMSWREQLLWSVFVHVVAALLVVLMPRLPFVQEAEQRRAERLAEIAELQAEALAQQRADDNRFVFVQPRVEFEPAEAPPPDAVLSDRDQVAESSLHILDPENRLPVADGNSPEFIVRDDPVDGLAPEESLGLDEGTEGNEPVEARRLANASAGQAEVDEVSDDPGAPLEIEDVGDLALADSSLTEPGIGPGDPDDPGETQIDIRPDGLLREAVENLRRSMRRETFRNVSGDTSRYGPEIQFDTKGVEFGPWIRRFVAQIRHNWFVPYAIWSEHGNVVVTFNVHRNGALTDLTVAKPARVEAFTHSAANALRVSNPTQPLPLEYPDDQAFFTVTFFFNELPPAQ